MGKVYDYPFSDQNVVKTLPDAAAHTYMAYMSRNVLATKKILFI